MENSLTRLVDAEHHQMCDAFNVSHYLMKSNYICFKILTLERVCNLDKTSLYPGVDLVEMRDQHLVTQKGIRLVIPGFNFRYRHRRKDLACIFAHGVSVLLNVVFRGERQPYLNSSTNSMRVKNVVQESWRAYWREDIA